MAVGASEDLSPHAVESALPERAVRCFPALLSTEAEALSWARAEGPAGAVVVADYQAAPRGRAGLPLRVELGRGLGFSLVLRPGLPTEREGWLYTAASCALADVVGEDAAIVWPDAVQREADGPRAAALGVSSELGPEGVRWAVVTVLIEDADPPRTALLRQAVEAIERRCAAPPDEVLGDYVARCATIGRTVRARLIPAGPAGPQVAGQAVDCLDDGALVLHTAKGNRVGVRPQHLGTLEDEPAEA